MISNVGFWLQFCRNCLNSTGAEISGPLPFCSLLRTFSTASIRVTFFFWNVFLQKLHILFSQLSIQIRKRDKRLTLLFQFLRRSTLPICEQLARLLGSSSDCQGIVKGTTCMSDLHTFKPPRDAGI